MDARQGKVAPPRFEPVLVEDGLKDGYWLDAVDINGDGRPDLIASGLALGEVVWYENPRWQKRAIHTPDKPVALDHADLTGTGRPDLVVCHDYGDCMFKCKPGDGKISWMPNGAEAGAAPWALHPVAPLLATRRLRFGHFTRTDRLELMALPVVGPQGGCSASSGSPGSAASRRRCKAFSKPSPSAATNSW